MTVRLGGLRRGVAQPGRAPGSGPGGRRFKSSLPDHYFLTYKFNANTLGDLSCSYDSLGRRTQVSGSFAQTGLPDGWRNESVVQNSGWPALS
jgi:hypothetical protein